MRDIDAELVEKALAKGLVRAEDVERVRGLVREAEAEGRRLYVAQTLVRERLLTCADLLALQDGMAAKVHACPHCDHRHARKELPKRPGARFPCAGCGKELRAGERPELSRIEVLTSRDPRDLAVRLSASRSDAVENSLASGLSDMDLDRYEVQDELGRGGYGVVFRAHQKDLDRVVALKVLRAGGELPVVALDRFVLEGRAASKLRHPNIVSVYDIGRSRDLVAMTMEYVDGTPLRQLVRERGQLPWPEACELLRQVLLGIEHAHAEGIVHRDLKTTNIIVEKDSGRPRIIDFGLAKDLTSDAQLTQANVIVGTPNYLSPEQVEGGSATCDARADVFALGVILYEMLCGKRPFEAPSKQEVYAKILKEEAPPIRDRVDGLPAGIHDVVHKALEKKLAKRWPTARAMREALEAAVAAAGSGPGTASEAKKRSGARPRPRASGSVAAATRAPAPPPAGGPPVALIAAVVGALLVVGGALALRDGPAPPQPLATTPPAPPRPPKPAPPRPATEARPTPPPLPAQRATESRPAPATEAPPATEPPVTEAPVTEAAPATEPPPATEAPPASEAPPATEAPPPAPVVLDGGERDAREFPELADRDTKDWVKRAFMINALAEDVPSPTTTRALRLALSDRFPLDQAFALRGLLRAPDELLRAVGSKGLFDALVDLVDTREAWVQGATQELLRRLAGGGEPRGKTAWKKWWKDEGEALFVEAARKGPPPPPAGAGPSAPVTSEGLGTRTRDVTTFMTQLRERGLDLVFLIDVTKSMTETLARVRGQVAEITAFMELLLPGKVRLGYLTYGDEVVERVPLQKNLPTFVRLVEGGVKLFDDPKDKTVPEGVEVALASVLSGDPPMGWRRESIRTLLLLGDAPPLQVEEAKRLAGEAAQAGFVLNAIITKAPPSYAAKWPAKPSFTEMAALGGGLAVELEDPEQLITRMLVLSFGSAHEADLRRFVAAYREVTGARGRG